MELSEKLKEYLINSLMRDKEEFERCLGVKEDVIAQIGKYNGDLSNRIEDLKYKLLKKEEECIKLENKIQEYQTSQDKHIKQYKELLDKYELATEMNKVANLNGEVKRGRPKK